MALPPIEIDPVKAMLRAAAQGDIGTLRACLAMGVDVNCRDRRGLTPLHMAARKGRVLAIEFLVERGADVNAARQRAANADTPLYQCLKYRQEEAVRALVAKGSDTRSTLPGGWNSWKYASAVGLWVLAPFLEQSARILARQAEEKNRLLIQGARERWMADQTERQNPTRLSPREWLRRDASNRQRVEQQGAKRAESITPAHGLLGRLLSTIRRFGNS
ncbi:MAG: ankyrin repeat domain-containing protein [Sumerlaeia bacterium]